jgi:hypothetical protein
VLVAGTTGVALFPPRASTSPETGPREMETTIWRVAWSIYFRSPDSRLIEITTYERSPV